MFFKYFDNAPTDNRDIQKLKKLSREDQLMIARAMIEDVGCWNENTKNIMKVIEDVIDLIERKYILVERKHILLRETNLPKRCG